jgi:hypothetical protein
LPLNFTDIFSPGDAHPQIFTLASRCKTILSPINRGRRIFANEGIAPPKSTQNKANAENLDNDLILTWCSILSLQ